MRIQHNIMAMNAYRNYNNNTSALSKNLEKLSSGYKINRAGDDAAGLAISEKMRAQITGLNAAQKNVKDGISLVKTAEGAMQEIEDMLNRMKYLATQSANGTYDNDVDRKNLQKEVISLKAEINRIAESANFNGIPLLDGSMSGAGAAGGNDGVTVDATQLKAITDGIATGYTAGTASAAAKQELDLSGLTFDKAGTVTVTMGGKTYDVDVTEGMDGKAFATELAKVYTAADAGDQIDDAASGQYTVAADAAGKLTITASGVGVTAADSPFKDFNIEPKAAPATQAADAPVGPTFKGDSTALAKFGIASVSGDDLTLDAATDVKAKYDGTGKKLTVTIDGTAYEKTFATGEDAADIAGKSVELAAADGSKIKVTMDSTAGNVKVGNDQTTDVAEETVGSLDPAAPDGGNGNGAVPQGALQLQIGDDAASYNQLFVSIGSMKTADFMGQDFTMTTDPKTGITSYTATGGTTIDAIDISTIGGATAAIDTIKNAINYVSSVRGDLGATQNRLDHTANNLSVMTENIQDAESTIRDTDVAEEMMAYTKNNILIQSAQAMLAQANAVPQGVLQLLG